MKRFTLKIIVLTIPMMLSIACLFTGLSYTGEGALEHRQLWGILALAFAFLWFVLLVVSEDTSTPKTFGEGKRGEGTRRGTGKRQLNYKGNPYDRSDLKDDANRADWHN
tara:strand:+ start:514 stop:840 length:327 start_codon:yes stop_codon:yes gene_type:complete